MIKIGLYRDEVSECGSIFSGPLVATIEVESLESLKTELESRFGTRFAACSNGLDGMFENSNGNYGYCLVSNVIE
jgi:hypothetical protein